MQAVEPSSSASFPAHRATSLSTWVLAVKRAVEGRGVDAQALMREVGMDPSLLRDPLARYPVRQTMVFWQRAIEATGEPLLGLDVARQITPMTFHALGYAGLASQNLADLFERLSRFELDWASVWVGLTDERWVDTRDSASNEHLVRDHLLRNEAAAANFVGLKSAVADPSEAETASWSTLAELPRPFDFVLLGMGEDDHIASLFPGSPGLARALDPAAPPGCMHMTAPVPPQARMSLTLRALLDSRRIVVMIVGADKLQTYQRARVRGPAAEMPVRALLAQQNVPVSVYWAP